MVFLIVLLGFATVVCTILALYRIIFNSKIMVGLRLETFTSTSAIQVALADDKLNKPFTERVVKPILEKLATLTARSMPAKKKVSLHKKLMMAGNPGDLSTNEFLVIQYAVNFGLPAAVLLITMSVRSPLGTSLIFALMAFIIGALLPEYYLKIQTTKRQQDIQKSLPDVLDLLTVSVEAGLGFDAALVKVVEKVKGVMAEEFSRVLQEVKMGKPRRDALRDLGAKTGVDDLVTFIGAIIQADQLGVSIGNVLRLQSEQMRQKRRQVAEEKAMKAPIKMLIPLMLFIFPTIFIVLLGPAIIEIIETMG